MSGGPDAETGTETGTETGVDPGEPSAASWSARYESDDTPWDLGRAHPELTRRLAADPGLGATVGRVLVPGCGRGHDALALAASGWDVVAVDMAPALEDPVSDALAAHGATFVLADALDLELDEPVDLVFDHTLFCALPLRRRSEFGPLCDRVLHPTGRVISVVFPIGRDHAEGGPPFGMAAEHLDQALGAGFERTETSQEIRVRGRMWPHRWAVWARS